MKHCKDCNQTREDYWFKQNVSGKGYLFTRSICRECVLKRHRKKSQDARRLNTSGVDFLGFLLRVQEQNGVCAICKQPPTPSPINPDGWCIDHCHKTGKVRKLLCNNCNILLGACNDNIEVLEAAIKYLEGHKS